MTVLLTGAGHGVAPVWTPATLGVSLLAWWDANTGVSETGGAVSAWADSVAALTLVQATADNQPVYSATSFNGRPGITFDGTNDRLAVEAVTGLPTGSDHCEMWALVDQTALVADTGFRSIFMYGGNAGATRRAIGRRVQSASNRAYVGIGDGASSVTATRTTPEFLGRFVVRGVASATTASISVNGGAATSSAVVPATGTTRTRIGASTADTPDTFWQGVIAAVLVTAALTDDEAMRLYAWLNGRAI